MGCGASRRPFERGWDREPFLDAKQRGEARRQWEQRNIAICTRRDRLCDEYLQKQAQEQEREQAAEEETEDEDAVLGSTELAILEESPGLKAHGGAFAWAPTATSGPATVGGLWQSDSAQPESCAAPTRPLLVLDQLPGAAAASAPLALTAAATTKPAPAPADPELELEVWTQNTPGRFRYWDGTGPGTQWTDMGDKIAPTESLEEYNQRLDRACLAEIAAIDANLTALTATIEELGPKIPAMERERKSQAADRNFKEVGRLRRELAEAKATLAASKAELEEQTATKAKKEAEIESRIKPPVETRILPRFRSQAQAKAAATAST
jgi:hypothetical protein